VPQYEEQERYDKIFNALVIKADQLDNNYDAAREVFTDFIAAYPRTPITKSVHNKIDEIDGNDRGTG
jgi:hypothetical protein